MRPIYAQVDQPTFAVGGGDKHFLATLLNSLLVLQANPLSSLPNGVDTFRLFILLLGHLLEDKVVD